MWMMSRDAADGVLQHVVGVREGLVLRDVVAQHFQQLLVEHHDQRVDVGLELGDAGVGRLHAAVAFELERLGDDAHGEDAHLLGHARDHRRGAGARAAAHAGGDEQHVGAGDGRLDLLDRFLGRGAAHFRLAAGAQALATQLDDLGRARAVQRLGVGVRADELDALDAFVEHVLDGVAAAAAHADDLDLRALIKRFDHLDCHDVSFLECCCSCLCQKPVPVSQRACDSIASCASRLMWMTPLLSRHHQKFPMNQSRALPKKVCIEPACAAALWPRLCATRASSSRPITVAERGLATMSNSAPE